MPLVLDMGDILLIMRKNTNSRVNRCTLMEQSLADRDDGEKLIDTKVGGVHLTNKNLQLPKHDPSVGYGQWPAD